MMTLKNWMLVSVMWLSGLTITNAQSSGLLPAQIFRDKINSKNVVVLDVRTPKEFADGYIANALNIDYNAADFRAKVKTLNKETPYYIYCLSGGRSHSAARYMQSKGFKEVYELDGGILKWTYPMVGTDKSEATPDQISATEYAGMTNSEKVVVIDFYAPWCGPCKKMKPMLDDLSEKYKGKANVIRINIDENKRLVKSLGISEIPVVRIYKEGKEQWSRVGMTEKHTLVDQLKVVL